MADPRNNRNAYGDAVVRRARRGWTVGKVLDYNPLTQAYLVSTGTGPLPDVPALVRDPGELYVIPRDTDVVLHDELGYYVIDSILKLAPLNRVETAPQRLGEVAGVGGEDPVYADSTGGADYRRANEPKDVLAGDWSRRSPDGNYIAVQAGGVNTLESSPLALVRTNAIDDSVSVVANRYRNITSMGDLEVQNEGGKTSLVWNAGSDQLTETGPNTGHWTLRFKAGAQGDLLKLQVTTPQGHTLSEVHLDANGRFKVYGEAGLDLTSGSRGPLRLDVGSDSVTKIVGDVTKTVGGAVEETLHSSRSVLVSTNDVYAVGQNQVGNITGNRIAMIGGTDKLTVRGSSILNVLAGPYEVCIGNPLGLAPPKAQGMSWVNYTGPFNFVSMPSSAAKGKFSVVSLLPASVLLGANGGAVYNPLTGQHEVQATATFGVMKYEPFLSMMNLLLKWLDAHTHPTAMGPSGPPMIPSKTTVQPAVPPIRSVRVAVGL